MSMKRTYEIAQRTLKLKEDSAYEQLRQLQQIGYYNFDFKFDIFANGVMMTCELYVAANYKNPRRLLCVKSQFIQKNNHQTDDPSFIKYCKCKVSDLVLRSLGLGGFETPNEKIEDLFNKIKIKSERLNEDFED